MDEVWELEALAKAYEKELETDPDDFGVQMNILSLRRRAAKIMARRAAEAASAVSASAASATAVAVRVTEVRVKETPAPARTLVDEFTPPRLWRTQTP